MTKANWMLAEDRLSEVNDQLMQIHNINQVNKKETEEKNSVIKDMLEI